MISSLVQVPVASVVALPAGQVADTDTAVVDHLPVHSQRKVVEMLTWICPFTIAVSKGCVQLLTNQITVVTSLAPRQIDRGDVQWPYTQRQKQGSTEADPVGRKRHGYALFPKHIIPQFTLFNKYIKDLFIMIYSETKQDLAIFFSP